MMRIDAYTHFFPRQFYEKLFVTGDQKPPLMTKRSGLMMVPTMPRPRPAGVPSPPQVAKRFQEALEERRLRFVLMLPF
jgi:hypothetical protein